MTINISPNRLIAALSVLIALTQPVAAATTPDVGTSDEARAMLQRAVIALRSDEPRALAAFINGRDGFRDRDLYVFCARTNGIVDAHIDPALMGRNLEDLYDLDGVAFGKEMMGVARRGTIGAIGYMWPKPGTRTPVEKVTFVTRTADQVCGVGYYK